MADLDGRHVFVTGGGTGIGAAIALRLAKSGAQITISGRREEPLRKTADLHSSIDWVQCDVTDADSVRSAVEACTSRHGAIDIAVANAGAAGSKPFAKLTDEDLRQTLEVNLVGVFNLWKCCLPAMKEKGWGRLIAIASTAALKGYPYVADYCAAKHGVVGMTRAVALEVAADGITANAICPGYVQTPLLDRTLDNIVAKTGLTREQTAGKLMQGNPQGRFIQPEEVAETTLWLCGDGAVSVNGQAISVCGGETS